MGEYPGLLAWSCMACMKTSDSFFACFSILHFFTFLSQNTPRKEVPKSSRIVKNDKKTLTRSSLEIIPAKRIPKCENRIPFNVLSLFPRVPGTPKSITNWTPNGPRNCKLWEKWAPKKTTKNKQLKSHQNYPNCLKLELRGGGQIAAKVQLFRPFFHPGPKMGPGVVLGSKNLPKASKRCQRASKR